MQKSIRISFADGIFAPPNLFLRTKQQVFCPVLNSYENFHFTVTNAHPLLRLMLPQVFYNMWQIEYPFAYMCLD